MSMPSCNGNPSANPANYTVRTSELSMQISDTADALRKAEEDVPRITADLEHSLAAAEQAVEQAQAPIADATRAPSRDDRSRCRA